VESRRNASYTTAGSSGVPDHLGQRFSQARFGDGDGVFVADAHLAGDVGWEDPGFYGTGSGVTGDPAEASERDSLDAAVPGLSFIAPCLRATLGGY
jgi:hypothetical protein